MIDPIGNLVIRVLDAKTPDVNVILKDFNNCLTEYKTWADGFWTGWAMDVDQKFMWATKSALLSARPRQGRLKPLPPAR